MSAPQTKPARLSTDARYDEAYMAAAIALGRRELGATAPNPSVGALVVRDGVIVGHGWTRAGGRPHAETEALRNAGERSRGATLYVSLEPCSHHGVTPPCAAAIIAAGVARVVSALDDPDPRVAGRGHRMLREAGVAVTTGVLAQAARRANLGHILRVTQGRPMVTLKLAETADGFAADVESEPRLMITGAAANNVVQTMRATHDAIVIGSGTARHDDPLLNVRLPGLADRQPLRVVLDTNLTLPPSARLVITALQQPTLVLASDTAPLAPERALTAAGVEVVRVQRDAAGRVDLESALRALAARGITRILSEGGPTVGARLIAESFADEIVLFTSHVALGHAGRAALDEASRACLADPGRFRLADDGTLGPTGGGVTKGIFEMFTGLVSDVGEVVAVEPRGALRRVRIACAYPSDSIALGASIACSGPCLTAVGIGRDGNRTWFDVDVAAETLARTTAGDWRPGTCLNLERSLKLGDELGGHIVSGHVDGVARIVTCSAFDGMVRFDFEVPADLAKFIAEKGSVSLDGTSLTVNSVGGACFSVLLIPHTLAVTTWGARGEGDLINLEVDQMARYAARLVEAREAAPVAETAP